MEMQVQSDSRIFLPGCAARRRIAGPCAPAGRRGAGTVLAAATGHVPSVRPSVRAATAAPAASPPLHGPSSKSQQPPGGGGCTPTPPRPGRGGSRGRLLATAPAAPAGHLPRLPRGERALGPQRAGGTGRGSTDGSRLRPGGVKGCYALPLASPWKAPSPRGQGSQSASQ